MIDYEQRVQTRWYYNQNIHSIGFSKDEENIKESIHIILMTELGTRAGFPTFGCGMRYRVFDNIDDSLIYILSNEILEALTEWEPRISISLVQVIPDYNNYSFNVVVEYTVIDSKLKEIVEHDIE